MHPSVPFRPLKIAMLLFTHPYEGTFYRAFPWAEFLAGRGHDVTLFCTSSGNRFRQRISHAGTVRIVELPRLFSGRRILMRLSGLHGWGPLDILQRTLELRRGGYDIVHTFEHHPNVSIPARLNRRRIPVLVSDWCDHYGKEGFPAQTYSPYRLHSLYRFFGAPLRLLLNREEFMLRRRADAVTVISSFLQKRAGSLGIPPEKITLIPGGADPDEIRPIPAETARRNCRITTRGTYLLFFGAAQFDVDFALQAFRIVSEQKPETRFIILGANDPQITAEATVLGVAGRIIQTGRIAEDQLNNWLNCADIFLLPMKNHPVNQARWPNKIGFYMAAGRPTVSTDVGDAGKTIAEHGIGLVSETDPAGFAAKTMQLLDDPALAKEAGAQARQLAENEYAVFRQGAELEKLYLELAGKIS